MSAAVALGLTAVAGPARAEEAVAGAAAEEIDTCLGCHGDRELSVTLPDGAERSLFVDREAFARSVHGPNLRCTDCHAGMSDFPHPEQPVRDPAERRALVRETCRGCHFDNYQQSFDSVHGALLARGDARVPSCADCHGGHAITPPGRPRSRISRTCAACHAAINEAYTKSVHGHALLETGSPDVPVCTDCHRAHDIADPRVETWLLRVPQLCGRCHTDEALMAPYGLSTNVIRTYLADFHGMTASLREGAGGEGGRLTALCIDCHGVHDISRVRDPGSPVLRANLVKTCQKCHPDASENFPAAWLSHYEPSWSRAPVVYAVNLFYAVFIPFVIGGLILQILLHLWRVVVNR